VTVTIRQGKTNTTTITREGIEVDRGSLLSKMIDDKLVILYWQNFMLKATEQTKAAFVDFKRKGAEKIITRP